MVNMVVSKVVKNRLTSLVCTTSLNYDHGLPDAHNGRVRNFPDHSFQQGGRCGMRTFPSSCLRPMPCQESGNRVFEQDERRSFDGKSVTKFFGAFGDCDDSDLLRPFFDIIHSAYIILDTSFGICSPNAPGKRRDALPQTVYPAFHIVVTAPMYSSFR